MYYVYVLLSLTTGELYKGKTKDLKARFTAHNASKVKSTKAGRPWRLIYYQAFINKSDAGREEKFLKSGKGRERLKYLLDNTLK